MLTICPSRFRVRFCTIIVNLPGHGEIISSNCEAGPENSGSRLLGSGLSQNFLQRGLILALGGAQLFLLQTAESDHQ